MNTIEPRYRLDETAFCCAIFDTMPDLPSDPYFPGLIATWPCPAGAGGHGDEVDERFFMGYKKQAQDLVDLLNWYDRAVRQPVIK